METTTNTTCILNRPLEYTKTEPIKAYLHYDAGFAYMLYLIGDKPYYDLEDLSLDNFCCGWFDFINGLTDVYCYVGDENIIILHDDAGHHTPLVNFDGLINVLFYAGIDTYHDHMINEYGAFMRGNYSCFHLMQDAKCKVTYNAVKTNYVLPDEDKDFIEFFISKPADKLTSATFFDNVCVEVYSLLDAIGYNKEIPNKVLERGILKIIKNNKKRSMDFFIPLNKIRALCELSGIKIKDWIPVWRRIANCYKIKEKNHG